jgi:hypothetical protein
MPLITEPEISARSEEAPALRLVEDDDQAAPSEPVAQVGAPRFVPKTPLPGRPVAPRPAPPADELAFLKSVTGDAPPRKTVPVRKPGEASPAAVETPSASQPQVEGLESAGRPTQQKTLKCGECGTLNRPTEWYCERCGAELAAL